MSAPTVHHRAVITWLAVYPTITLASILTSPYTAHLPVYLRTLILTALVVPVVVYGLMPLLLKGHAATRRRRTEPAAEGYSRSAVV
ncbi:hypothetical protein [Kitasatospora sp. NBC_01266]|uniref:hypothetical protein n=1 Tax=Kitasatospora sp. NBC_01266 TaxID=2903572 RepID=UPI002E379638|nr:hypothetical protein [Kitasatospora sp. NBC_01266]